LPAGRPNIIRPLGALRALFRGPIALPRTRGGVLIALDFSFSSNLAPALAGPAPPAFGGLVAGLAAVVSASARRDVADVNAAWPAAARVLRRSSRGVGPKSRSTSSRTRLRWRVWHAA